MSERLKSALIVLGVAIVMTAAALYFGIPAGAVLVTSVVCSLMVKPLTRLEEKLRAFRLSLEEEVPATPTPRNKGDGKGDAE